MAAWLTQKAPLWNYDHWFGEVYIFDCEYYSLWNKDLSGSRMKPPQIVSKILLWIFLLPANTNRLLRLALLSISTGLDINTMQMVATILAGSNQLLPQRFFLGGWVDIALFTRLKNCRLGVYHSQTQSFTTNMALPGFINGGGLNSGSSGHQGAATVGWDYISAAILMQKIMLIVYIFGVQREHPRAGSIIHSTCGC